MPQRSPIIAAVIAALAVAGVFLGIGNGLMRAGFSNAGIIALSAVVAVSTYFAERNRGLKVGTKVAGGRSPELIAFVDAMFGAALLFFAFLALRGDAFSWGTALFIAAALLIHFYLWERERQYLLRGRHDFPIRWLTAEKLLMFFVTAGILIAVNAARQQPGGLSQGDMRSIVVGSALLGALSVLVSVSIRRERARLKDRAEPTAVVDL